MTLNVQTTVTEINSYLELIGFKPRDADGNDFQKDGDNGLRFKTGTSYGEVAIQIWRDGKYNSMETIRVLHAHQTRGAMDQIWSVVDGYNFAKANGRLA